MYFPSINRPSSRGVRATGALATVTAALFGATLLATAAAPVAAQGCDGCSASAGAGAGKIGLTELAGADAPIIQPVDPAAASLQPVGNDQFFRGLVNGRAGVGSPAIVRMACFGPLRFGQTGHPFAGQTVAVIRIDHPLPGFPDLGFTGSLADNVHVDLASSAPDPAPDESIVLSQYDVPVAIPTSISLPCAGQGVAEFTPSPTTPSSQAARVPVVFVGQP